MPDAGNTLAELRVLDLSGRVAGAYASKLFADYGADVIAVEPPAGSPLRRQGPFAPTGRPAAGCPHRETGALWLYLGTNKRSVTLDIETATGQAVFRRMAEEAAVIIEDFEPGRMEALDLGYETLLRIKRRLILVSITPFGQTGHRAAWKATNLTSFASGGQMSLTGDPDREPLVNGGQQAAYQAGLNAFAAAAVAAVNADTYEVPQHIDISMQECMAAALELYLPWWAYLKRDISQRKGNILSAMVGMYPAKTGFIGLHIMPRNWPALTRAMGRPELADDPRFKTNFARLQNNDELEAMVYEWAAGQDAMDVYHKAGDTRAPVAAVHSIGDLFASPQLKARGFFHQTEHPEAGSLFIPGPQFRMSEVEWSAGRAPLLGEHNAELYCDEMGMSRDDLLRLRAAGVV
ncbi:MAG TPA: CoA transferase [Dehalococcoidia bacterium]|nr:CoA transferase [Dehalococcoidia bacterium]